MELAHLPVIDWSLGTKLAGNKKDLAEDMLSLLIHGLNNEMTLIKQNYQNKNYQQLLQKVHKLHGAACYCGVPRLKSVIASIESDLKNNIMINLPSRFKQLDQEVSLLLKHYHTKCN